MQIQRLYFRKDEGLASAQAACRRLRLLTERGYLTATRLPALVGSGPLVYQLGRAARMAIEGEGSAVLRTRNRVQTAAALRHSLEIVDFYIALKEALEEKGGEIITWWRERQAQCRFTWEGQRFLLTPDASCQYALGQEEGAFLLEWDRGTESLTRFSEKLATYEGLYAACEYRDVTGGALKPRLVVVTGDERRANSLADLVVRGLKSGRLASLPTVLVGARDPVLSHVLGPVFRRASDGAYIGLAD